MGLKIAIPDSDRFIDALSCGRWAIYAAFVPMFEADDVVKIGISSVPTTRVAQIHSGSPFPVEGMLFSWVGNRSQAQLCERGIHLRFADRKTRGEWFRFNFEDHAECAFFHASIREQVFDITHRRMIWQTGDFKSVITAQLRASRKASQPKPRRKRYFITTP